MNIKAKKQPKIYTNKHKARFAVVRKLRENRRYYCNFRVLYETREEAETEAKRMCGEHNQIFFVIEIQTYASNNSARTDAQDEETGVEK